MVRSHLADMEGWNGQTAVWSSYPNDEALARGHRAGDEVWAGWGQGLEQVPWVFGF